MKNIFRTFLTSLLLFSLLAPAGSFAKADAGSTVDISRDKLLGYMLSKQLPVMHFSDKVMDDDLAFAAFDLYLKQLDFQKRFLLQSDVDRLSTLAPAIDNNLLKGHIILPEVGYEILTTRIGEVEKMTGKLLAAGFDYNRDESYETDPEKLKYASNLNDLRARWRKILKGQIISRYLDLTEEQEKNKEETKSEKELWKQAEEKLKLSGRVFTQAHEGILITDADGLIVDVNPAFSEITGYSREEILHQNPSILRSDKHDALYFEEMWNELRQQGHWQGHWQCQQGRHRPAQGQLGP